MRWWRMPATARTYPKTFLMTTKSTNCIPNRFVWDDYLWSRKPDPYTIYGDHLIPAHIPLPVMLGGSIMGDSQLSTTSNSNDASETFRAVPRSYFEQVCPRLGGTKYVNVDDVNKDIRYDDNVGALEILERWVKRLDSMDDVACVSNGRSPYQMWEIWSVFFT